MTSVESASVDDATEGGLEEVSASNSTQTDLLEEEKDAAVKKSEDRSLLQREGLSPKEVKNKKKKKNSKPNKE